MGYPHFFEEEEEIVLFLRTAVQFFQRKLFAASHSDDSDVRSETKLVVGSESFSKADSTR